MSFPEDLDLRLDIDLGSDPVDIFSFQDDMPAFSIDKIALDDDARKIFDDELRVKLEAQRKIDDAERQKKNAASAENRRQGRARASETRSRNNEIMATQFAAILEKHPLPSGAEIEIGRSNCSVRTQIGDDGTVFVIAPEATTPTTLYHRLMGHARAIRNERNSDNGNLRRPAWLCLWQAHLMAEGWMEDEGVVIPDAVIRYTKRRLEACTNRARVPTSGTRLTAYRNAVAFASSP